MGLNIKLELGRVVSTLGYQSLVEEAENKGEMITFSLLRRHMMGDWGEVCKEDWVANDNALDKRDPQRVLSVYEVGSEGAKVWVITAWDRSVTALLLPEEY
jgi:hypothetical protein